MNRRIKIGIAIAALFVLSPVFLHGQCTVSSSGVNFGSYQPLSSLNTTTNGTIIINCTGNYYVRASIGPSPNSGGFNPRKMQALSGSDLLSYNLYTTGAGNIIWGDGTGGTSTVSFQVKRKTPGNRTVYGNIPAEQDVSVGQYGESLVMTIDF